MPPVLVADANVLIDYAQTEPRILALCARHWDTVLVPTAVLDEVGEHLDQGRCAKLGPRVLEPTLEQALLAAAGPPALSWADRVSLVVARDERAALLTNDRALRSHAARKGIPLVWGLEAMAILCEHGSLTAGRALAVAIRIRASNPTHITAEVRARFTARVRAVDERR